MQFAFSTHPGKTAFPSGGAMDQLDLSCLEELSIVSGMAAQILLFRALRATAFQDQYILGQQRTGAPKISRLQCRRKLFNHFDRRGCLGFDRNGGRLGMRLGAVRLRQGSQRHEQHCQW